MLEHLASASRRVGMQAHMVPTLISTIDHLTTFEYPYVAFSPNLEKETRDCKRKMLMIVTLRSLLVLLKEIPDERMLLTRYPR